jgi:hypothetical protein
MLQKKIETEIADQLRILTGSNQIEVRCTVGQASSAEDARSLEKELSSCLKAEVRNSLLIRKIDESSIILSVSHSVIHLGSHGNGIEVRVIVVGSDRWIGVDTEYALRPVHSKLNVRILSEKERTFHLKTLEAWVIKEAAFKSFPLRQGTLVSQYQIFHWDPEAGYGEIQLPQGGRMKCQFSLLQLDSWLIAMAHTTDGKH